MSQKYSVHQYPVQIILNWVAGEEIAIPEIQRPFVWDSTKVRDLIDSLYKGFPVGYLIAWKNPNIRLKDGSLSRGKKILIDGQQRVTALTSALLGRQVVNKDYKKVRIQISFNPLEERFEVFNPAIAKDSRWMPDIAPIVRGECNVLDLIKGYCTANTGINDEALYQLMQKLQAVNQRQIGLIELEPDLDIETVTEIFIRINSKGVVLSQADFAMSKITSNEKYDGPTLRKLIDFFCHLCRAPEFYEQLRESDKEFTATPYFKAMSWLRNENDDLYDPDYSDMLRVAFTSEFRRGRISDLVSLLSGRNFETRTFEEEIAESSFTRLKSGLTDFINETNFKRFVMIIKSAGFVDPSLVPSQNAMNFAYALFLTLRKEGLNPAEIESYVRRWFVLATLKSRYSGQAESTFEEDITGINEKGVKPYLEGLERAELSEAYWQVGLVHDLEVSSTRSPQLSVFFAAQTKSGDLGFLSKDISVRELIEHKGDIHHVFPKDYLKKKGSTKKHYNQLANYVYMQSEINIGVGRKSPMDYLQEVREQCESGDLRHGSICTEADLLNNLRQNCIPEEIFTMTADNYDSFLEKRRELIASKIKTYYQSLA